MALTDNQVDVLDAFTAWPEPTWLRPMDLGGRNGSHHSNTLRRLAARGWVEMRRRAAAGGRGSYWYRITAEGVEALRRHQRREPKPLKQCTECEAYLRPGDSRAADHPNTQAVGARGLCMGCYQRDARRYPDRYASEVQ